MSQHRIPNSVPNPDLSWNEGSPSRDHFRVLVKKHAVSKRLILVVEERVGLFAYKIRSFSYIDGIAHDSHAGAAFLRKLVEAPLDKYLHSLYCIERYMVPEVRRRIAKAIRQAELAYGPQTGKVFGAPSEPFATHVWLKATESDLEGAKEVPIKWIRHKVPKSDFTW